MQNILQHGGWSFSIFSAAKRKKVCFNLRLGAILQGDVRNIHKIKVKDASGKDIRLGDGVPRPKWLVGYDAINYDKNAPPLGSGNFADVYLGTFVCNKDGNKQVIPVAIKIIKPEKDCGREAKQSMIREGKIMSFYNHENVVQFYGVACDRPPIAIVMEYCPGGSLENHLKKQKENIVIGERIEYCLEAALGMRYLHMQRCLHRDLAARNCLISMDGLIKISDFGLSKTNALDKDNFEMTDIPVRWMAPETLVKNPYFSKKSDVWSFGVLLYEVFNMGIKPWPNDENKKIATNIRHLRMPQMPVITPLPIKALVSTIWIKNADNRPSFKIICKKLYDMQKGDLKPPPIAECAVNRIPNVKRVEYTKIEHILDETEETVAEPVDGEGMTTEETIEGGKRVHRGPIKSFFVTPGPAHIVQFHFIEKCYIRCITLCIFTFFAMVGEINYSYHIVDSMINKCVQN